MAWFYTVLLAVCSAGILGAGIALTRRLFRDELLDTEATDRTPRRPVAREESR
ncbi:hypothetical protein [Actinomycetospora cinnamomea]|uniref:Uncharacterized protein n=1 Tax=Actinomycetospora cinnamomea TaxID=663609 RepID=A0A2U1EDD4_9PSEU|nr:hypothetical protein [Actinomycetospora cinnamomea]PVY97709.1 hypothetical protein C8D89_12322 [Actinomycetospora cinnamomea]